MHKLLLIGFALTLWASSPETVENGRTPSGKAVTIEFTENLRLGPDSGEDYHAWSGATVTVDVNSNGHIFVVDTGSNRIVEFNKEGEFVQEIGQKGQGPGEFQFLKAFRIFKDGSGAVAFDDLTSHAQFSDYDKDIKYQDQRRGAFQGTLESLAISPNGDFMGSFYMTMGKNGILTHTAVLDKDLKPVIKLGSKPAPNFDPSKLTDPNWWVDFYASWFKLIADGIGLSAFSHDGHIYTAMTNKYEITKYNDKLEKVMVIKRDYKPIIQTTDDLLAFSDPIRSEIISTLPAGLHQFITPTVVNRALEKADFPPSKQPIFGMIPMEDGGLMVVHNFKPQTGESYADIFSKEGKFVGQSKLPPVAVNFFGSFFGDPVKFMFYKGQAYAIEVNEDEEPTLVRYNYKMK